MDSGLVEVLWDGENTVSQLSVNDIIPNVEGKPQPGIGPPNVLRVGTAVHAFFYGTWYPAHVNRIMDDGLVEVLWDGENTVSHLPSTNLLERSIVAPEALLSSSEGPHPRPPPFQSKGSPVVTGPSSPSDVMYESGKAPEEFDVCCVCIENPPNTVLLPCMHTHVCFTCSQQITCCPICYHVVEDRLETHIVR